jgi:hypothetical protein
MNRRKISSVFIGASALFACTLTAKAANALISEHFDYSAGAPLNGQNGGTGFTGAWIEGGDAGDLDTIALGTLTYPLYVGSGNSGVENFGPNTDNNSTPFRDVATIAGAQGGPNNPLYVSFLMKKLSGVPEAPSAAEDFFGLALYGPPGQDALFIGDSSESVNFGLGTAGSPSLPGETSSKAVTIGDTALLLVKIDFSGNTDTFSLYVNPDLSQALGAADAVKTDLDLQNIQGIGFLGGYGTYQYDEIRAGTSIEELLNPEGVQGTVPDSPIGAAWVLLPCFVSAVVRRYRARQG